MDPGEQTTGTRDEHYNLVSVLYHALHGAENCEIYMADAEATGRDDLAAFFREAQAMHTALAERAKGHLGIGGTTPGDITEGAPAGGATGESGIVTSGAPGDIPPGSGDVQPVDDVPDEPPDAPSSEVVPMGDVPPRTAQSGWETPPPGPRRASPAETEPPGEDVAPEGEAVPPDAPRTQEPPPRTGDTPPSPSEQPPR